MLTRIFKTLSNKSQLSSLSHTCIYMLLHVFMGRPFKVTVPDLVASNKQVHCCLNGKWLQNVRSLFHTKSGDFALVCKIKGFAALRQGQVSLALRSLPASAEHLWPWCSTLITSTLRLAHQLAALLIAVSCIINAPDTVYGISPHHVLVVTAVLPSSLLYLHYANLSSSLS